MADVELIPEQDEQNEAPKPPKPTDPMATSIPRANEKFPAKIRLQFYKPSVSKHIAKVYVHKADGSMEDAVRWLRPGFDDIEYREYARYLLRQDIVRAAIAEAYQEIGIDEKAKEKYIGKLWREVIEGTTKEKQVALPLLGRALGINEMADEGKTLQELPIKGLDAGWKKMTDKEAAQSAQSATGFDTLKADAELDKAKG